jgi:HTH-type transcriptional regulator/antitoxin MqsA
MTQQPKSPDSVTRCPACRAEGDLTVHADRGEIRASDGAMLPYATEYTKCGRCGEEFLTPEQTRADSATAGDAIREHFGLLTGSRIRAIRERLGFTQAHFEALLGVGPKTVVRWERGTVCPSATADALMRLVEANPDNVIFLRRLHGLEVAEPATATASTISASLWVVETIPDARRYVGNGRVLTVSGQSLASAPPKADAPSVTLNQGAEVVEDSEADEDVPDALSGAFAA